VFKGNKEGGRFDRPPSSSPISCFSVGTLETPWVEVAAGWWGKRSTGGRVRRRSGP
jgi:hypothetical protein